MSPLVLSASERLLYGYNGPIFGSYINCKTWVDIISAKELCSPVEDPQSYEEDMKM